MSSKFLARKTMISIDPHSLKRFSDTLDEEKNKRLAQETLHDLVSSYKTLEQEMQRLLAAHKKGEPIDLDLLALLQTVSEKYLLAIHALRENEDEARHALIVLADAVQDLMTYRHKKRKH